MFGRYTLVAFTAYAVCSVALSRCVVFFEAYDEALSTQRKEDWLLEQCLNSTFYANMRMHTNVCEKVRRNAERSPMLNALDAVARVGVPTEWLPWLAGLLVAHAIFESAHVVFRHRKWLFRERDVFV